MPRRSGKPRGHRKGNSGHLARCPADIYGHLGTFPAKVRIAASPRREQVPNENLRAALQQTGLAPDDLAQIAGVDVRTVRRWLSGGTPYARQRAKVARALDTTEHDLWPDIVTPPPSPPVAQASDILAAYRTASDLAAPDWKALMRDATDRIDLLGDTLITTLATPGVPELLAAKATRGCHVRILIYDTRRHLAPLVNQPGIEIRLLEGPAA
jgi:transcriptional regulator with XRE-family HTH domain